MKNCTLLKQILQVSFEKGSRFFILKDFKNGKNKYSKLSITLR